MFRGGIKIIMHNLEKSLKIKQTMRANKIRRANMDVKVFEVKIDESHLSEKRKRLIQDCFVQARWIYNYLIGCDKILDFKSSAKNINIKVFNPKTRKCDRIENRILTIGSQIKEGIFKRTLQNIINLSKAKSKGMRVGKLKFKKEINSIPLNQFGITYKIYGEKYIRIQGVGKLKVSGLGQIKNCEFVNAALIKKSSGYFIKLTYYKNKEKLIQKGTIGLDFGIKDSIINSEGNKFDWKFDTPKELRQKQQKLSRKVIGSKNFIKQKKRVKKSYENLTNKKNDAANKFVSSLKKYEKVVIQDENIKGWHAGLFGKTVQCSILGRIKTKIKNLETSIVINRYLPTTKISPINGKIIKIGLDERTFRHLDYSEDRDVKSAKTILCLGLYNPKLTRKELMGLPAEELAAVFSNYKFEINKLNPMKQEALAFLGEVAHGKIHR